MYTNVHIVNEFAKYTVVYTANSAFFENGLHLAVNSLFQMNLISVILQIGHFFVGTRKYSSRNSELCDISSTIFISC